MSSVRVNQALVDPYNVDGTPGTVSSTTVVTATVSTDQIAAAVSGYLTSQATVPVATNDNLFGAAALGSSGAYVNVGTPDSINGAITVGGSVTNANLSLVPKGTGRVLVTGGMRVGDTLSVTGVSMNDTTLNLRNTGSEGNSVFYDATLGTVVLGSNWTIKSPSVMLASVGTGSAATVDVIAPDGSYRALRASAFTVTSDRSIKDLIVPLEGGLNEVLTTPVYTYLMNEHWHRGLIADEAPQGVRANGEGLQMLDLYSIVGTLWSAVQELHTRLLEVGRCSRFPQTESLTS